MAARSIKTVNEVIDALGGTGAVAVLMSKKPQHVSNWRAEERIAAETYLKFEKALKNRRLSAPPELWGILKPTPTPRKKKKHA